jgi:casein kinase II subunit alpha
VRRDGCGSVARVYADVNAAAPREYWDYEALAVTWGDQDAYEVVRKVGRGKYSEVFEGRKTASDERCIIKARKRRAQRCAQRCARMPAHLRMLIQR